MDIVQFMESLGLGMPGYSPDDLRSLQAQMESNGIDWRAHYRAAAAKTTALYEQHISRDEDPDRVRPPGSFPGLELQALTAWLTQYKAFYEQEEKVSPLPAPQCPEYVAIERTKAARLNPNTVDRLPAMVVVKYPYRHSSSTPFRQLERVALADTFTHKVHTGKYLLCRTIAPAGGRMPVMLAVEDPMYLVGTVMIYHFPTIFDCFLDHLDAVFPVGTVLAIREPAYDPAYQFPRLTVRVDSPTDIVFLSPTDEALRHIVWESDVRGSGAPALPSTTDGWKGRGDAHFKNGEWLPAAIAYSHGLAADPEAIALRLNRVLAFSRLESFSGVFADAELIYKASNATEVQKQKALYHLAKAAYGRGQYEAAEGFFKQWQESNPESSEVAGWIERAQKRIAESRTGRYDWVSLLKCAKNDTPLDIGNYQGPIAVQAFEHRGGGRGVVATEDINVGALLLVEKPIDSVNVSDDRQQNLFADITNGRVYSTAGSKGLVSTLQKLYLNPDLHSTICGLYAGPAYPPPSPVYPPAAGLPAVDPLMPTIDIDIMKLENICVLNGFNPDPIYPLGETPKPQKTTTSPRAALFLLASLFNHSCAPNAIKFFVGDTIVVKAVQQIKAGEEIMINYMGYKSYLSRMESIKIHLPSGCSCWLCEMDLKDGTSALQKRQEIWTQMHEPIANTSLATYRTYERILEESYSSSRTTARIELSITQSSIAVKLCSDRKMLRETIKYDVQALKNLGFTLLESKYEPIAIATSSVPSVTPFRAPALCMIRLCRSYLGLKDKVAATKWLRALRWYISVRIAEGNDLFLYLLEPLLNLDPGFRSFVMRDE